MRTTVRQVLAYVRTWPALIAILTVCAPTALAQPYPNKPIRIIVPFAPGGGTDATARLLQQPLSEALGQTVVLDNRPGASGILGTDVAAKAPPDGYTLLIAYASHTVNPAVNAKLPYNPEKDLAPIILVGKTPLLLYVNSKLPVRDLSEFVALAKSNTGKFNYATPGAASQAHLILALLSGMAGVQMQHIPYRGGAPAVMATVAGETQLTAMSPIAAHSQVEAGYLRPIATGSLTRDKQYPDVPTISESGYPDFEAVAWVGLFTSAGTPRPIIARINSELNRIIRTPDIQAKLDAQGITIVGGTPDEFGQFVTAELRRWSDAAKRANILAVPSSP
jgi:tripartite-type tricarboxylate transporter receptor subunit TctC